MCYCVTVWAEFVFTALRTFAFRRILSGESSLTSISLKITRNLCRWRCSQREGGRGKNHGGSECFLVGSFAHICSSTQLLSCFIVVNFFLYHRFDVDLSRLPLNERQLYTHVLDPGKGRLVFLVTLRPCWGVSISEIESATLTNADERDAVIEKFVCFFFFFSLWLILVKREWAFSSYLQIYYGF